LLYLATHIGVPWKVAITNTDAPELINRIQIYRDSY